MVDEKILKGNVKGVSKAYPNGSRWLQNCGNELTIVELCYSSIFKVKFDDSPVFKAESREIRSGTVTSRNLLNVCGVGYIGYGKYHAKTLGELNSPAYEVWRGIIRRCYDPKSPSAGMYHDKGIYVEEDWHNFQNFAEWYYRMLSDMPKDLPTKFDVDKDLKGGKCYSKDNCILLPYKLNNFIQNRGFSKGMGYVKKSKDNPYNKITTTVSLLGKQIYIGLHETQEDSDKSYNIAKNYVNRKMATEYLTLNLITESTAKLIMKPSNSYTLEDEAVLFKKRPTLQRRIDALFINTENLLKRCKNKKNAELYKGVE